MIRSFLKDRLSVAFLFFIHTAFLVLTISLYVRIERGQFDFDTTIYLFMLSAFFFTVWLAIDYIRNRPYLKKLHHLANQRNSTLDSSLELKATAPPSMEAQTFLTLYMQSQETARSKIERLEQAQAQHHLFINQWVHQMKTPVSVISLLVEEGKQSSAHTDLLNDIAHENDRLRHGLELMLHTARLDHFSFDLKAETVDLASLTREIINAEKRQFIRRGIYPEVQVEGQALVTSDAKWLRVILEQLVHNALKYSPQKQQARITFSFNKTGKQLQATITDSGIGIPASDLPRIFDPFFTGENGRTYQESTGMGLYLARTIARELGHKLYVESIVGKGTTATLLFSSTTLHKQT
ncbi:sensor histidine kinase [Shouchella patagoniensis]|uniref:sensor histidine kinase n=1 Tax=Shouchella patagoniensis TaxID=228576 RepID=UPI000994FF81|nr:sensor histidine kinase [Shouchella patagoniensis]